MESYEPALFVVGTVSLRDAVVSRLVHDRLDTTNIYLRVALGHRQEAIDRAARLAAKPGRYLPRDTLSMFLEAL